MLVLRLTNESYLLSVYINAYRLDRQVLCSKIAPWQNSSPELQNSSPEFQNSPVDIETKGSFLAFRGAILQSRGAILPGGYFAAQNLTVLTVYCVKVTYTTRRSRY